MRFDELSDYAIIREVREEMKRNDEQPGADTWTSDRREELWQRIAAKLPNPIDEYYLERWRQYRKSTSSDEDGEKKIDIIIRLANCGMRRCFYEGRGLGECSDEVELDRIVPGSAGGKYVFGNCVISCKRHNAMRGNTPLPEFISGIRARGEE